MNLSTVTVTENTPYQADPYTGEPLQPYNNLQGDDVAPTETKLAPGTYALVPVDAMEKVRVCGEHHAPWQTLDPTFYCIVAFDEDEIDKCYMEIKWLVSATEDER